MTRTQMKALNFVRSYVAQHGFSPSYDEIATALGVASKGNVHRVVMALLESGHLRRERSGRRNLVAVVAANDLSTVPTAALIAELGRRAHG
jgi:repressor LexA